MEKLLGSNQFVAGDTYSVADIDLLVVIDFANWIKLELPDSAKNAKRWHEAVSQRPSAKL